MGTVTEEQVAAWKREFQTSAALQHEFGAAEIYAAFKKADAEGRVKVIGGRTNASASSMKAAERRDREFVSDDQLAAWKREWQSSADLRREFTSEGSYVGFKTGEAQGRIRIMSRKD